MKRIKKLFIIIVTTVVILTCMILEIKAEEVGVESIKVSAKVTKEGNVDMQTEFSIYNPGNQPIEYINLFVSDSTLSNIVVYDRQGKLNTNVVKQQGRINSKIHMRAPLEPGNRYTFNANLTFEGLTESNQGSYVTRIYIPSVARPRSHEELLRPGEAQHLVADSIKISILLPENMFFYGSIPQTKVYKDSNSVRLIWEGVGSSKPGLFVINYGESPKLFTKNLIIYIIIAFVLCICILVLVLNLRKPKKSEQKAQISV